jgi:pyruvate formate-lyase/glycerol dehydratase family glycyl radical enzyme
MSTATQELRDNICRKFASELIDPEAPPSWGFKSPVRICLDRARLITESYRETEGEPEVIRRAKALAHILGNMTIYIRDGERIVGDSVSDHSCFPLHPEVRIGWVWDEVNSAFSYMLDDKGREELKGIVDYWRGKSIEDRILACIPDSLQDYILFNGLDQCHLNAARSLMLPNFETLFRLGLNGVIGKAEEKLNELKADMQDIEADDYIEQRQFLEAAIIACRAVINFAERYARLARDLARVEKDSERKKELEEIAGICDRVPANPCKTLREAMQSLWFGYLINRMIELAGHSGGIRLDYLMYPFYQKDKEAGRITREEAQELTEFLFLKIEEMGQLVKSEVSGRGSSPGGAGSNMMKSINIGGVTPEGKDATNEFSFIVLDAAEVMRTTDTDIALRYHSGIDPNLVLRTIDLLRNGLAYPKIFNDDPMIPVLVNRGWTLEDARSYTIGGCVGRYLPGKATAVGRPNAGILSLGKCLELALNQGTDPVTGKQLGCPTPDPTTFKSIEDVMEAYLEQVRYVADKIIKVDNLAQSLYIRYLPRPFSSALIDGCIENALDCSRCVYDPLTTILCCGNTNVADSMAAMKKLVFEDKLVSMAELLEALKDNWEGREELRQKFLKAPKFGNDDDYVDLIMKEVTHRSEAEVEKSLDYYGYSCMLDGSIAGGYYRWGEKAGATPDGRKAKDSFADAVMSPMAGRDYRGPTAIIKSVSKVKPTWSYNTNQMFMPQYLEGENKNLFADYLRTWADLGNWQIQFNVVDKETLRDAQAHPEDYRSLVVRVAGYCAYFVDLPRGLQNEIIARTCHTF